MAHFYIYGDESGNFKQSDYVSFCGYVGHGSEWERVSMEWNNVRLAWGVPPLHMRCVMFPGRPGCDKWAKIKAEWGNDWENKRAGMLTELGAVIRRSTIACVGGVVDSAHFRSMPDSRIKQRYKDPVFMGFHTLLMESLDKVDRINKCPSVSLVIDDDEEYAMHCYQVLNALKTVFPRVRERVSAMTVGNDNEYPGLQVADMIAFEARSRMVAQLTDKDSPPTKLYVALTRNLVHQPRLWTSEYLDDLEKRIGERERR